MQRHRSRDTGLAPPGHARRLVAEIEPFPSAVLAHHYPNVPNHGDMTKLAALVLAGKWNRGIRPWPRKSSSRRRKP